MQTIPTRRSVRLTVQSVLAASLLAASTVHAVAPTGCGIARSGAQHALAAQPDSGTLSRAHAMVQGATLSAPKAAAVALALFGLALLPAARRRPGRTPPSP
jgi:hypothetical protein